MTRLAISILRGLQVVLALTSIGLSSYVVHWFMMTSRTSSFAPFSFLIFTSVFSILSVIYLEAAPRFAPRLSHSYVSITVEMLNTAFYFGGFIAIAVFIGNLQFCQGTVCSAGRADTVMAAAQFTSWIATTFLLAKDMFIRAGAKKSTKDINHEMQQA
ncbi:hypothetical protein B0T10DRAFT_88747 [Thelonectria olida]|uniref:MARVEL domain-containing protein n=1 Tax=Thelonectria olida TaxID=1576542 RepID=A0A9P9AN09_9HYPO|nr:hypothetical protein B0T10DRAFT_88747 [Thelonectria olida]